MVCKVVPTKLQLLLLFMSMVRIPDEFICSVKPRGYSSYNWSHHMVEPMIIHCNSPRSICLLHRPNRLTEWGCNGNHHLYILQGQHGSTNIGNLSSTVILPLIYYCPSRFSTSGFHVAFPMIIPLTLRIREPMWRFCQLLNTSILNLYSRIGEITRWVRDSLGPLWDTPDLHGLSSGYTTLTHDFLELLLVWGQCPSLQKLWLFPFL